MENIVTKRIYQSPTAEIRSFDTIDVVQTSNAAVISYKSWANGATYDSPFSQD